MNYELAKQLKEAGFPQETNSELYDRFDHLYYPHLSELISACGDNFHALLYPFRLEKQIGIKIRAVSNIFVDSEEDQMIEAEGTTPEEAVANLYLALNKSDTIEPSQS